MSVREITPLFSWGFSFRRSKFLVPLFQNNVFSFGSSATSGTGVASPMSPSMSTENMKEKAKVEATACRFLRDVSGELKEQEDKPKLSEMSDEELVKDCVEGSVPMYSLEKGLGDCERAAGVRRKCLAAQTGREDMFDGLPLERYEYDLIMGACCENVVGYLPLPVGIAGPINLDGEEVHIPMATTEGCLVASAHRGCKAITMGGGAKTVVLDDGMTRAPVLLLPSLDETARLKSWLEEPSNLSIISKAFSSTSRFARLKSVKTVVSGRRVYLRFRCSTGDAMGMNMISKAVTKSLKVLEDVFPDMVILAVSGNYCTDKKPAAVNWIDGRGKYVVAEAIIPEYVVEKVLKTTVPSLVELNISKNYIGSAMAGALGGFNAHASNIVTAVFLACGQDPAQNVESSNCITTIEATNGGKDLYISCTMPCIEVGTVGGGTHLPAQSACLNILKCKGANAEEPGKNAKKLARVVCAAVMAGELSLMSALAAGHLVRSHMRYNRSSASVGKLDEKK